MSAGKTGCRSAAAATLSVPFCWAKQELWTAARNRRKGRMSSLALNTQHHHFRRLDEGGRGLADLQLHFPGRFSGDDRGNNLPADGKFDLGQQALDLQLDNAAG